MKKQILITTLFLSFSTTTFANIQCPRKLESYSNIQLQQSLSGDGKKCYLSIHPRDAFETLIYRDYLFTSDGLLLIFNSLKPDEGPGSSGAREFFFFAENFKQYSWKVEGQELIISGFQNLNVAFSLDSAQITKIDGATVQVAKEVNAKNQGGVEFMNPTWPFLDAGFFLGNAPSAYPRRNSTLKNQSQQSCVIQNSQLFNYVGDDPQLKSKAEIAKAAAGKCPGFAL